MLGSRGAGEPVSRGGILLMRSVTVAAHVTQYIHNRKRGEDGPFLGAWGKKQEAVGGCGALHWKCGS